MKTNSNTVEYIKFSGVMISISVVSLILFYLGAAQTAQEYLRWFMGVFSVTFAVFKFAGYNAFTMMFRNYDVVAKRFSWYSNIFPVIQLSLGLLFLFNLLPTYRSVAMLIFSGVASIGVLNEISKRRSNKVHCACLGNIIKLPLSTVSFVEDAGMFILSIVMLSIAT